MCDSSSCFFCRYLLLRASGRGYCTFMTIPLDHGSCKLVLFPFRQRCDSFSPFLIDDDSLDDSYLVPEQFFWDRD